MGGFFPHTKSLTGHIALLCTWGYKRRLHPKILNQNSQCSACLVQGKHGDGGFHTHQFSKPDMRWVDTVRKSHPGCSVAYVLDQDTQLESYEGLDVHRISIDKV